MNYVKELGQIEFTEEEVVDILIQYADENIRDAILVYAVQREGGEFTIILENSENKS